MSSKFAIHMEFDKDDNTYWKLLELKAKMHCQTWRGFIVRLSDLNEICLGCQHFKERMKK